MMRSIVRSSLRFKFLVIAAAAGLMVLGFSELRGMPVDVFPEFAPPRVEIQTPCLGLSPEEVESLVTVPLEQALNGIEGLDIMRSKSVPQLSSIVLIFKSGANLMRARQEVQERLATVEQTLPTWASPPFMMPPVSATSRIMKIGMSSDQRSLIDMSMVAYWIVRERLLRVPGVANVAIWGERLQMYQVQVDPQRLVSYGVTLDQVMETTSDALDAGLLRYSEGSVIGTGGFMDTPSQRFAVHFVPPILTPGDLAEVTLATQQGAPVVLADVARVVEDHQPLIGDAIINDGPGLLLIVEKFPWANTLAVTRGVEDALDGLKPGMTGIDFDSTIFRPATFIEMSIANLTRALLLGALLVVIVLVAFLYEWRVALISCIAIPLSLLAALVLLQLQGATVNVMILAGLVIALGAVVDDAIIDVENIVRRLREHRKSGAAIPIARVILEASVEVRNAIVYATLIEIMALMPVFLMQGLSGSFFRPLAVAYALAVGASMAVALTVTPALSLVLLRNVPLERRGSPVIQWLHRRYMRLLAPIVRRPRAAFSIVGMVVLVGAGVMPFLGQSLLPSFKERDFLMHWVTAPGTSHPEMARITVRASKELRAIPGVRNFGAHIGQALLADEVVGVNFTENWISVDPRADYSATVHAVERVVAGYPGLYRDVLTYLKERIREVLTGTSETIVVRIYGPDLVMLRQQADLVREALAGTPGIVDLHVDLQTEVPQIRVQVDLAAARSYGLKPGDVRRAASTLLAGEEVGDLFLGGKAYDVQVWATPETRRSLMDVQNLLLDTPSGRRVRMSDVASVAIEPTPNVIEREGGSRRIDVGANVRGRDLGQVARDVERRLQSVAFPLGYHPEVLGEYAERQAAQGRLAVLALAALVGILLLLQVSFGNWRLATLAFLTLPSALVGGVLATYVWGGVISLGSLVGFLTILGIAARNGIMLISHYQHLEREEGMRFGTELILRGARERLAPILMTATTTALALVPLVIAGSIPGHEIEHPMAVVILGGLVTSTLLNLFVMPSLYARFGRARPIGTPDTA